MGSRLHKFDALSRSQFCGLRGTSIGQKHSFCPYVILTEMPWRQSKAMIILGLKCYSHDTGAAIVSDESGSLVLHAISEARLNRRKHSFTYPLMSIAYCLNALGLEHLDQVDRICIDRHMEIWPEQGSQFGFQNAMKRHLPDMTITTAGITWEQTLRVDQTKVQWVNHVDAPRRQRILCVSF